MRRFRKAVKSAIAFSLSVVLVLAGLSPAGMLVSASAGSQLGVWQTSNQFTITENGTYVVYARDAVGNVSASYEFTVSNIDYTPPTLEVGYSTTSWTKDGVSLVIDSVDQASPGGTAGTVSIVVKDGSGNVYPANQVFTSNVSGNVISTDDVGNSTSKPFEITWIDKTNPTIGVSADVTSPTNGNVVLTLTGSDGESGLNANPFSWDGTNWSTTATMVVSENGTYTGYVMDAVGNISSETISVVNIDKTNPSINGYDYSTTDPCNTTVVVTVNATDVGLGLHNTAYSFNDGAYVSSNSFTATANGTYTVKVRDKAGNEVSDSFTVSNLDFGKPVISSVTPNTTEQTNQDVTLTVTATDNEGGLGLADAPYKLQGYGDWQSSNVLTVSCNGTYTVEVKDKAGNIETSSIVVGNIDKEPPTAGHVLDITSPTNTDVVATLTILDNEGIKKVVTPDGTVVTQVSFQSITDYTFSASGSYKFEIWDTAGNKIEHTIDITNIDKVKPVIDSIDRSTIKECNTFVDITVNAHDDGLGLEAMAYKFTGGDWQSSNVLRITENGTYSVSVRDVAGNVRTETFSVLNLDFDDPVIDAISLNTYAQSKNDLTMTVDAVDVGLGLAQKAYRINGGAWQASNQFTITENGIYTIEVTDAAGNIVSDTMTVTNIDKVLPTISASADTTDPVNRDVVVTITASDNVGVTKLLDNSGNVVTGTESAGVWTYTISEGTNGTYVYTVVDTAGNENTAQVVISNIDKQLAVIVAAQSVEGWTTENHDLIVSFTDDTMLRKVCVEGTWYDLENGESPSGAEITEQNGAVIRGIKVTLPVSDNKTFEFKALDFSGNETSYSYTVESIDRVAPEISATPDITSPTNGDVDVSITASDSYGEVDFITLPDGTKVSSSTAVYKVGDNGTYKFIVHDKAGNSAECEVIVNYVDKTAPSVDINLGIGESEWSNTSVIVTIKASDENPISEYRLTKDGVSVSNKDGVFEISENGTYEVLVVDSVGNVTKKTVVIGNIDKDEPTVAVSLKNKYWVDNKNVLVVSGEDSASGVVGFSLDGNTWQTSGEFEVSYSSSYTVYVKDGAGNVTSLTVSFEFIEEPIEVDIPEPEPEPEEEQDSTQVTDDDNKDTSARTDLLTDGSITVVSELTDLPLTAQEATQPASEKVIQTVQKVFDNAMIVVKAVFPYAAVLLCLTLGCLVYILVTDGVKVYGKNKNGKWQYLGIARCHKGATGFSVSVSRRLLKRVDSADFLLKFNVRYSTINRGAELTVKAGSQSVSANIYRSVEFSVTE